MTNEKQIQDDWDEYWTASEKKSTGKAYDVFANFYRYNIIIKILNHFIKKHFKPGDMLLHAGCGSGKVDMDVVKYAYVTALDISPEACKIYKLVHGEKAVVKEGSIFHLPFDDNSFDGIYNLGVMEHFTEEEIQTILKEFYRVLKPKGKIVLFWPPVNGVTVKVLDSAHFILNNILKKNIKLHPDEITRLRNKEHAMNIIKKTDFAFIEFYFGIKDFFTQAVVVAQK